VAINQVMVRVHIKRCSVQLDRMGTFCILLMQCIVVQIQATIVLIQCTVVQIQGTIVLMQCTVVHYCADAVHYCTPLC